MRTKLLLMVALTSCSSLSFASDWRPQAKAEGETVYIDHDSIARAGKNFKAWTLWNYEIVQRTSYPPYKEYRSVKVLYYYDCVERTAASIQSAAYEQELGKGSNVDGWVQEPSKISFADVVPDTIGESVLREVCRLAKQKFPTRK